MIREIKKGTVIRGGNRAIRVTDVKARLGLRWDIWVFYEIEIEGQETIRDQQITMDEFINSLVVGRLIPDSASHIRK